MVTKTKTQSISISVAQTITVPRIQLINTQIRVALRRTSNINESSLRSIEKGILNKWINRIDIYGFDKKNYCRAQLSLEIDWNEHGLQISKGKVSVTLDESWNDNTSVEIDEAVRIFNRFLNDYRLSSKWTVTYRPELNRNNINAQLGFSQANPIKWVQGKNLPHTMSINELPELKVGFKFVE